MIAYIYIQDPVMLIGLRGLEGIASVSVLPPTRALMNSLAPKEMNKITQTSVEADLSAFPVDN